MDQETSPPVVVNVFNSNEGIDNGNSSAADVATTIDEQIPAILTTNTELVEPDATIAIEAGTDGTIELGNGELEPTTESADSAVEIARINAERDVTIAVIEADADRETAPNGPINEELEECRQRILTLEQALETIQNSLTPTPSTEVIVEPPMEQMQEELETAPETNSTDEYTQVPTVEIGTALSAVNEDVEQDLNKVKPRFIPL
jgi:hypothetical protein